MRIKNQLLSYGTIVAMALILALNYYLFIIENGFAPAGLNGIATMIQYKTGFSISYMSLIINLPLCLASLFIVGKDYAAKSAVFTVFYSAIYLMLQKSDLDFLKYVSGGHDSIFPVIISGVISGFVCGISFKNNSCSGGMEIVSKCIGTKKPAFNFFAVTFVLNTIVALISLFVYSENGVISYKPVALCITYCFVTNFVGNYIMKGTKSAYKFTVITTHPNEISDEVTKTLRHGVTRMDATGGYSGASKTVLLCVVNRAQINDFRKIVDKYDDTFSFCETVSETYGNFKHIK